ncbi:MAG: MarR family transcriptional regulator [Candidatus Aminicenantes bacterium]|nr:MarR family transcriptional regulator [Candidatus Aminicenantes bacterium]
MDIQKIRFLREKLRVLERQMNDPFGDDAGCCGLTLAQCHTLLEVGYKGEVSLVDLASSFGLDTSTLSRMIQSLVVLGLVSRLTNEKDRRYVTISLTEQGKKLFDEIEARFNTYFFQVVELIPLEKQDPVIECIGLFSDAVRKHNESSSCREVDRNSSEKETSVR